MRNRTASPHLDQLARYVLRSVRSGWVLLAAGLSLVVLCLPAAISAVATPRQNQGTVTATPIDATAKVVPTTVASASPLATGSSRHQPGNVLTASGSVPVSLVAGAFIAPVDPMAALPDGQLMIPSDAQRVGWWSAGSAPGDPFGSVVLVGHLDTPKGGLGVFYHLLNLTAGQRLVVKDSTGHSHTYTVVSREQVARTSLPASLFSRGGPPRLVLITCGGNYDRVHHRYDDNTIVVAAPD